MKEKIIICSYDEQLLPEKKTDGAVCWDIKTSIDFDINSWDIKLIWAWFKTYIPNWRHAKFYARSSLPTKWWLLLANSVAIIDSDYRWEYLMQFYNYTKEIVNHTKYDRLCQLEFCPHLYNWKFVTNKIEIEFLVDKELYDNFDKVFNSVRGNWWIGSTGNK